MCQHLIKPYITEMMAGLQYVLCTCTLGYCVTEPQCKGRDSQGHLAVVVIQVYKTRKDYFMCCQGEVTLSKQDYI